MSGKTPRLQVEDVAALFWCTGVPKTKDASNVYAIPDNAKTRKDYILIGSIVSPKMAEHVIQEHNGWLV